MIYHFNMKDIFNKYRGRTIKRHGYKGILAGYNSHHFILAIESADRVKFFRLTEREAHIQPKYRDSKYRYEYCDESTLLKL